MKHSSHSWLWLTGISLILIAAMITQSYLTPNIPLPPSTKPSTDTVTTAPPVIPTDTTADSNSMSTTPDVNHNLNTAAADELTRVAGIGEVLANRIIAYRSQLGGFTHRSQLLEIDGVGPVLLDQLLAEFEIPNEQLSAPSTDAPTVIPAGRYDLNQVTKEELLRIQGMSQELADQIIALRELIHYYTNVYELMYIESLSGVYFEEVLKQHLYVNSDTISQESFHP